MGMKAPLPAVAMGMRCCHLLQQQGQVLLLLVAAAGLGALLATTTGLGVATRAWALLQSATARCSLLHPCLSVHFWLGCRQQAPLLSAQVDLRTCT